MNRTAIRRSALAFAAVALVLLAGPDILSAQASQLPGATVGQQSLRPYWHVFVAYSIVIVLIGGWAISIARRLRGIEDRLVD
jgi:CcmD family protein